MISVLSFDSTILGHLIIIGYDCLDEKSIKELGDWQHHISKIHRFNFKNDPRLNIF